MRDAGRVESFTRGDAIGVDVAAIERELAALWREASAPAPGSAAVPVTRACLWNLVVRTNDEASFRRAARLVDEIAPAMPARVIVLRPGSGETELEAWISANCYFVPGAGKQVCSEEVTIAGQGRGREHFPALVRALVVPDMPTAVYWTGPPDEDPSLSEALLALGDRIVFDDAARSRESLAACAKLLRSARHAECTDLGWLRQGPLRVASAALFDPPVGPASLARIRRLAVTVPEGGGEGSALLFAGWLASRLEWEPGAHRGGPPWRLRAPHGQVTIECHTRSGAASPGVPLEVEIDAGDEIPFAVRRATRGSATLEAPGLPPRTIPFLERTDAEQLVGALGRRGDDSLFLPALERAADLLGVGSARPA